MIEEILRSSEFLIAYASTVGLSIVSYFASTIPINIRVIKENKNKKIKVLPTKIINECKDIDNVILDGEFKDIIKKFYEVLKSNIDNSLLANFEKNIKDLQIHNNKKFSLLTAAYYEPSFNSIYIGKKTNLDYLYHELLHMSSTHREKNILFSGFTQYTHGSLIGTGFDEGYTELFKQRYLSNKKSDGVYQHMVKIISIIEDVVGKDNMTKYYFQSDLDSLCNCLKKYLDEENIKSLIDDTDYLVECFKHFQSGITYSYNLNKLNNINKNLSKMLINKLKMNDEYNDENINAIKNILPSFFYSRGNIYKLQTEFENQKYIAL